MKRLLSLNAALIMLALCGCGAAASENRLNTRFLYDTVIKLDIECDRKTLDEAFELCERYSKLFDRWDSKSDISKINASDGKIKVSSDTAKLIERSLYFSRMSDGAFDITLCPVIDLWDFEGTSLPDRNEIAEALKSVDYGGITVEGNTVSAKGKKLDVGGIAKGYIADRLKDFFYKKGVKKGIINLGGNVYSLGEEKAKIGIAKPFEPQTVMLSVEVSDMSVVTSGIYQRYFEKDGVIYHHIIDPKTGMSAQTDIQSATVIGKSSADCDALATVCVLYGRENAKALIDSLDGYQAIFILSDGSVDYTAGLYREENEFYFKR